MADTFEITVHERSIAEKVTGKTVAAELEAQLRAAEARHAYERVLEGDDASGWSAATKACARAGIDAAVALTEALGKKDDRYRVTIHGGDDHLNLHVQRVA